MRFLPLIFIAIFLLNSCAILNTPGFFSGYNKLNNSVKDKILNFESTTVDLKNDSLIYFISGVQMNKLLKDRPNVLVYTWAPDCSSESCYLLSAVQQYCFKNNIELFIVTEYFEFDIIEGQYTKEIQNPLFAVDFKHYKTNYCNKYMRLFKEDLLDGQKHTQNDLYNRYFFFSNGKLTKTGLEL
jgi:hypothetical protein